MAPDPRSTRPAARRRVWQAGVVGCLLVLIPLY
ncbi:MAG: hypothetical protein H6Q87_62, partial [candidate division NC10 bacterium]|nr:hypothetical protein [candidate division NC10 bacterium]